eukprot:GFKZ01011001.1.p1 GENE.GFKZ01011001.1~~GFKZ01011001.1.p1  ORF type:complete len:255 (+),score=29.47 GFKZ01011001.1:70-834(+)
MHRLHAPSRQVRSASFNMLAFMSSTPLSPFLRCLPPASPSPVPSPASLTRCQSNAPSPSSTIEVERKFYVSDQALANISRLPTTTTSKVTLRDSYYCESLALSDRWLRHRNDTWQLKVPLPKRQSKSSHTTVYREITGPAVWRELNGSPIDVSRLVPYATIITDRQEIHAKSHGTHFSIVLDACAGPRGFRYNLGEIEVLVDHSSKVSEANALIDRVAKSLGIELHHTTEGKLMRFLRQKNPQLYYNLDQRGLT